MEVHAGIPMREMTRIEMRIGVLIDFMEMSFQYLELIFELVG